MITKSSLLDAIVKFFQAIRKNDYFSIFKIWTNNITLQNYYSGKNVLVLVRLGTENICLKHSQLLVNLRLVIEYEHPLIFLQMININPNLLSAYISNQYIFGDLCLNFEALIWGLNRPGGVLEKARFLKNILSVMQAHNESLFNSLRINYLSSYFKDNINPVEKSKQIQIQMLLSMWENNPQLQDFYSGPTLSSKKQKDFLNLIIGLNQRYDISNILKLIEGKIEGNKRKTTNKQSQSKPKRIKLTDNPPIFFQPYQGGTQVKDDVKQFNLNAVESTTSGYCDDDSRNFDDFLIPHIDSEKNFQNLLKNQQINHSHGDSITFFSFKDNPDSNINLSISAKIQSKTTMDPSQNSTPLNKEPYFKTKAPLIKNKSNYKEIKEHVPPVNFDDIDQSNEPFVIDDFCSFIPPLFEEPDPENDFLSGYHSS